MAPAAHAQIQPLEVTYTLDLAVGGDLNAGNPLETSFLSQSYAGLRRSGEQSALSVPFSPQGGGPASAEGRLSLDAVRVLSGNDGELGFAELDFSGRLTRSAAGLAFPGDNADVFAAIDIANFALLSITGELSWTTTQDGLQFSTANAFAVYDQAVDLIVPDPFAPTLVEVPVVDQAVFQDVFSAGQSGDFHRVLARADLENTLIQHDGDTVVEFSFTVQGVTLIPTPGSAAVLLGGLALGAPRRRRPA